MTPKEAAAIIGCSPHHVRHLIRNGTVNCIVVVEEAGENQHGKVPQYQVTHREAKRVRDLKKKTNRGRPRGSKNKEIKS